MVDFMSMGCLLLSLIALVLSIISLVKVNKENFGNKFGKMCGPGQGTCGSNQVCVPFPGGEIGTCQDKSSTGYDPTGGDTGGDGGRTPQSGGQVLEGGTCAMGDTVWGSYLICTSGFKCEHHSNSTPRSQYGKCFPNRNYLKIWHKNTIIGAVKAIIQHQ